MARQFKLSAQKFEELKNELDYLKRVREREVADQIKEARSFGDLSENSEYDEAKNEQGKLYARITEVETILSNCVIVSDADIKPDEVCIGSTVVLCDADGGEEEITLVGSQESDPINGRISDESPLGRALMGKKKGAEIRYTAPGGDVCCKIKEIRV
jgi:transcription elongation factor GreA